MTFVTLYIRSRKDSAMSQVSPTSVATSCLLRSTVYDNQVKKEKNGRRVFKSRRTALHHAPSATGVTSFIDLLIVCLGVATTVANAGGTLDPFEPASTECKLSSVSEALWIIDRSLQLEQLNTSALSGSEKAILYTLQQVAAFPEIVWTYLYSIEYFSPKYDLSFNLTVSRTLPVVGNPKSLLLFITESCLCNRCRCFEPGGLRRTLHLYAGSNVIVMRTNIRPKPTSKGFSSVSWKYLRRQMGTFLMYGKSKFHMEIEGNFKAWLPDYASFVYNPIVISNEVAANPKARVRRNKLVFVSAASKGLVNAVEAFEYLDNQDPSYELFILSPGYSLHAAKSVVERFSKNNSSIMKKITIVGALNSSLFGRHVASSLAVFYPGNYMETFGSALVEANCLGTPVLHEAVGSLPEVLCNPAAQLYTKPSASESLIHLQLIGSIVQHWRYSERPTVCCPQFSPRCNSSSPSCLFFSHGVGANTHSATKRDQGGTSAIRTPHPTAILSSSGEGSFRCGIRGASGGPFQTLPFQSKL
eukprot:scaffold187_cov329-Pavlova_lutheri.AAC.4